MAQNLVNFVVGIKDQAGNICGTGFVIADRVIATCAHVIDAVKAQPGQTVTVIFSPINKDYLTMVWPAGYQSHNDVAILIGHEPLPSGIQAAILCSPALSRPNVEFSTSGYRRLGSQREGIPAGGKLIGQMLAIRRQPLPSHPPLILESKQIADGMSGAPLYIPEIDRVVGIVTSYWDAERGQTGSRDLETAFAMPAEAIAESWPQLPFKPPTTGIDQDDRTLYNRHVMLQRVKEFWVEGFLEQSLHTTVLIELTLKEQSAALYQPWDTVLQRPYHPDRLLPAGTKLVDLFDKVGQALLILGEPGAGKTTTLLELARELITRAEKELAQPIPAIFPLASWSGEQGGLAAWLVEELNTQYRIPRQISQGWVEKNELVLLLDGLDEVAEAHRSNCVQAINDFCREHLAPVVVCSRREEFERLQTKFSFSQAILLQPLTPAQIENYLTQLGPEVTTIQSALQTDPSLYELVQSPLTLNIMILAYRDLPATELSRLDSTQARYRHLFKNYVQQMFERGGPNQGYTQEQTLHWLTWLAQQMCRYTPGVFYIEGLQPNWLLSPAHSRLYVVGIRLVGGSGYALGCGLAALLVAMLRGGTATVREAGLAISLIIVSTGLTFSLASVLAARWPVRVVVTALVSLVALVVGSLFSGVDGLLFGLVFGLIASLAGASIANTHQIQVAEALSWSYGKAIWGLTVGLAAGLIVEIVAMQSTGLFVIALPIGLALMLYQGLSRREVITSRIWPNQGIWQSAQNALKVGGTVSGASLICSLLVGLWVGNLRNILSLGLIIGVMASLTAGLAVGGAACLQHGVLRCILARSGYLPWRMTHFLDYGVKHILLSRVGGGYVFIHRRLMEYFAGLESD